MNELFLIAHISDLHIKLPGRLAYGRVDIAAGLVQCLETLARLPQQPDAVLLTGDLTDFGRPEEYDHLLELLTATPLPMYPVPGNHDQRAALAAAFARHGRPLPVSPESEFLQYSCDIGPLRLLALDTLIPGAAAGGLCPARLAWLARELARTPRRPTVLAMHHPPMHTFIGHMDDIGFVEGLDGLRTLLIAHPQVELVACGHLHRLIAGQCGGRRVLTAPAPAHQVALDLRPDAPSQFMLEPPGFLLHAWSCRNGLVSHQVFSGQHEGPYPFFDEHGLIDD
ncbi:phosphodiesterase [Megalodesulfovibrio paquesii]